MSDTSVTTPLLRPRLSDGAASFLRKLAVLALLAALWQAAALWTARPMLLPSFTDTIRALVEGILEERAPRLVLGGLSPSS